MAKHGNAADWARGMNSGFERTSTQFPEGFDFYKLVAGKVKLDVIPYIVGKGNPRCDEGLEYWHREYFVHWVPMPGGKSSPICCLWQNFGKKCPICNLETSDQDLLKQIRAKSRMLMNVIDLNDKEKKIKILDVTTYNRKRGFGEVLQTRILTDPEMYQEFYALKGGYSLRMILEEVSFPGGKAIEATVIDFIPREDYPKSILKKACCLDECLIRMPPDKLEQILNQGDADEDEEEETPKSKREDPDDDDDDEDDDDVETSSSGKGSKPPTKKTKHDEDDDDDEDEDDETPPQKASAKKKYSSADEDDEDAEDDEDEDAKPTSKKSKTAMELGIKQGSIVEYDDEEHIVGKVSKDGTSLTLTLPSGQHINAVDPNECKIVKNKTVNSKGKIVAVSDDEDEDDDSPPKKKSGSTKKKTEPDDDEDDDEDDDDEPAPKKGKTVKKSKHDADDDDDDDDDDD